MTPETSCQSIKLDIYICIAVTSFNIIAPAMMLLLCSINKPLFINKLFCTFSIQFLLFQQLAVSQNVQKYLIYYWSYKLEKKKNMGRGREYFKGRVTCLTSTTGLKRIIYFQLVTFSSHSFTYILIKKSMRFNMMN